MLYLDVTGATRSAMNSGVPRTIRALARLFEGRATPLCWNYRFKSYTTLSSRQSAYLTSPFGTDARSQSNPDWNWNLFRDLGWSRQEEKQKIFSGEDWLTKHDLLLIPDLCWDSRIWSWDRLSRSPGKKVAVFHDAMPIRLPGQAHSNDSLFAEYMRRLALFDEVICVSAEVQNDLLTFWDRERVRGCPTTFLPWPMPFFGTRPQNEPRWEARHLIYVARLRLRKNHLTLLEACETLWRKGHTFSLDLIGSTDAFFDTAQILLRVARLKSRGFRLRWRKHISEADLNEAYRQCSFTLFPSLMEGFGLPILESLWHQRPVICGSGGAIGEVSAGGGCLQIDQSSPREMEGAIMKLLTDQEEYQRLFEEAQKRPFRTWTDYEHDLVKKWPGLI